MNEENSINPEDFTNMTLEELRESQEQVKDKRRFTSSYKPNEKENEYWERLNRPLVLEKSARRIMWEFLKHREPGYKVTIHNKEILGALAKYALGDPCKVSDKEIKHKKGIYLWGEVGRGKTKIIQVFNYLSWILKYRPFKTVSCVAIASRIRSKDSLASLDDYYSGIYCFDDLGREKRQNEGVQVFGNRVDVMETIINYRERANLLTHATSNTPPELLGEYYDPATVSRIHKMFNFIELKGPDYRKL